LGRNNKPIGCGASGAYAPGPDDEEEDNILDLDAIKILNKVLNLKKNIKLRTAKDKDIPK
jgi:hypothetical protein